MGHPAGLAGLAELREMKVRPQLATEKRSLFDAAASPPWPGCRIVLIRKFLIEEGIKTCIKSRSSSPRSARSCSIDSSVWSRGRRRRTRSQRKWSSCKPRCSSCWMRCSGCNPRWMRVWACWSIWHSRPPIRQPGEHRDDRAAAEDQCAERCGKRKVDSVSGQVQSLNDSVDELKARIAKLDKSLQDLQTQLQAMQAAQAQPQPGADRAGRDGSAGQGLIRGRDCRAEQHRTGQARNRRRRCKRLCRPACAITPPDGTRWPRENSRTWCTTIRWMTRRAQLSSILARLLISRRTIPRRSTTTTRCWKDSAATPKLRRRNCTRDSP